MHLKKIIHPLMIIGIRWVSALFRMNNLRACRFYPSCSKYSVEAFQKLNTARAFHLMSKRILSCHPFSEGGYDPLPENSGNSFFVKPSSPNIVGMTQRTIRWKKEPSFF